MSLAVVECDGLVGCIGLKLRCNCHQTKGKAKCCLPSVNMQMNDGDLWALTHRCFGGRLFTDASCRCRYPNESFQIHFDVIRLRPAVPLPLPWHRPSPPIECHPPTWLTDQLSITSISSIIHRMGPKRLPMRLALAAVGNATEANPSPKTMSFRSSQLNQRNEKIYPK